LNLSKSKKEQVKNFLGSILDVQDSEVIVVRDQECKLLFANEAAQKRLQEDMKSDISCKKGYADIFPRLCTKCERLQQMGEENHYTFDLKDGDDQTFAVACDVITWLDGKLAKVFFLRNVEDERANQEKLYRLAYMDHLTGVPNRQKLKEDFEAVHEEIAAHRLEGIMAIFDLDNFKSINDSYGHNTGDILLQRLTEYLEGDEAFRGHLYRLGGDEFVLLYAEKAGKFANHEAFKEHYSNLLKGAFLTYTMPNIDKGCTISMGVASLPDHGDTYSELLRKADIALYKAKDAGRNQMVFFEDQYEVAEKFKDLYINIQPILTGDGKTFGYELVDMGNEDKEEKDEVNLTEFNRTIDALGLNELQNDARYFISFSKQLLDPLITKNLPKDKFIVQLRADDVRTAEGVERYKKLRDNGFIIALTEVNSENWSPDLLKLAGYCKFQFGGMSEYNQAKIISGNPKKIFIATNIDHATAYNEAKRRGFRLYQGFFFDQPVIKKKTKEIDPLKFNYLRLLKLTSTDDYVDFREISSVISSDVALSYKLLKLLNSAAVGLRNNVSSISMAVAYLGEENLKKWISMLALRGIGSDEPLELVRISLIRAHFGELLAPYLKFKRDSKHIFLVGLLSLLHIALDKTREELFEEIPVADDIRESLLTKHGIYSDLVAFYNHYEYGNWEEVSRFAEDNGLNSDQINDAYMAAVKWYNELART